MLEVLWHDEPPSYTFAPVGRVGLKVWYDGPFLWTCRSGDTLYRCCLSDARDSVFLAGFTVYLEALFRASEKERLDLGNKLFRRAKAAKAARAAKGIQVDKSWTKLWPTVMAFMTEAADDEDKPRELSKVSLFFDGSSLRACLTDPTNEQSVYVTLDSPGAVLDVLEAALSKEDTDWRSWGKGGKRK